MDYTRSWLKQNPENFPVTSKALPPEIRTPVMALYAFARGADEMAGNKSLSVPRRRQALMAFDEAFASYDLSTLPLFAHAYAGLARLSPPLLTAGRDLLSAFAQDTFKNRYHDYNDLLDFCQRSAAPVGRVILTVFDEKDANVSAADSLCNALQILDYLQNCKEDYVKRDRVYLPLDWFMFAQVEIKALAGSRTGKNLRRVLDRALDNCDTLLKKAEPIGTTISDTRLRHEVNLIYMLARRLSLKLRRGDPLAAKVTVGKWSPAIALARVWHAL